MDASTRWADQQFATVNDVLNDLGAGNKHVLTVFNKADLLDGPFETKKINLAFPDAVMVSAFNEEDMKNLKIKIAEVVQVLNNERAKSEIIHKETKAAIGKP
jgi:50S ribosomal subunit-associated GTPase HflX